MKAGLEESMPLAALAALLAALDAAQQGAEVTLDVGKAGPYPGGFVPLPPAIVARIAPAVRAVVATELHKFGVSLEPYLQG